MRGGKMRGGGKKDHTMGTWKTVNLSPNQGSEGGDSMSPKADNHMQCSKHTVYVMTIHGKWGLVQYIAI